jgi:DNA-binding beta-propeller fold protein YncE
MPILVPRQYVLVANWAQKGPVLRYDLVSGDFVDPFIVVERPDPQYGSRISLPLDVQIGPDGWVYLLTGNPREVWRINRANGTFAAVVVPDLSYATPEPLQAFGMAFGPDNNLYLATMDFYAAAAILRFDLKTGAPLGVFVEGVSAGFRGDTCIAFGPDGNLYIAGESIDGILRFNGWTGAFLDAFVAFHPFPNNPAPRGLAFGPDGNLYALAAPPTQPGAAPANRILRYNGATGAAMGEFVSPGDGLGQPSAIAFGPDGNLYVGTTKPLIRFGPRSIEGAQILVYSGATGDLIRTLDPPNRAALTFPFSITFAAIPISIRDILLLSRLPGWVWPLVIGFIGGVIGSIVIR